MDNPYYNQGNLKAFEVLDAYFGTNPHLWNAGKYLMRCGRKGTEREAIRDLEKAVDYIQLEITTRKAALSDLDGLAKREAASRD